MSANDTRGEIALALGETEYVLRPSNEAIRSFERATGKGVLELAQDAIPGKLTSEEIATIATECIRAYGRSIDDKQMAAFGVDRISDLIMDAEQGLVGAASAVRDLLINATTGGYTSKGEVKAAVVTQESTPAAE